MNKVILSLMFVFILIFIAACQQGEDLPYTIEGNSVCVENSTYGKLIVTPHTCSEPYCCQEANMTSYLSTQDLDVAFRFDNPISKGRIYRKMNITHQINNISFANESIWNDTINDWSDVVIATNNHYNITYPDWVDVSSYMSPTTHNDKHYYIAKDIRFVKDKTYNYKWCYYA